jgi:hypothetical protein
MHGYKSKHKVQALLLQINISSSHPRFGQMKILAAIHRSRLVPGISIFSLGHSLESSSGIGQLLKSRIGHTADDGYRGCYTIAFVALHKNLCGNTRMCSTKTSIASPTNLAPEMQRPSQGGNIAKKCGSPIYAIKSCLCAALRIVVRRSLLQYQAFDKYSYGGFQPYDSGSKACHQSPCLTIHLQSI